MYLCYLGDLLLPVTPEAIEIKDESTLRVLNVAAGGQVCLPAMSGLAQISFKARLPIVKYPFSVYEGEFKMGYYFVKRLREMKNAAKPIWFRFLRYGRRECTDIACVIETLSFREAATDGGDIICSITLREYAYYKTGVINEGAGKVEAVANGANSANGFTGNGQRPVPGKGGSSGTYIVKKGDTLWTIARKAYGNGDKWKDIYKNNTEAIEQAAKKRGKPCSSGGNLIFEGTRLKLF